MFNKNEFKNYRTCCPVCHNNACFSVITKMQMNIPHRYRLPAEYLVVRCSRCGFVYADTSAVQEDYNYYYSHFNAYSWNYGDFDFNELKAKSIAKLIDDKNCSIINIGSGSGWFEKKMFEEGYHNITGLDVVPDALDSINKDISSYSDKKINTVIGSIYECNKNDHIRFDVVVILSVLEHLLDLDLAMANIKTYLNYGGTVIIEVPDYSKINMTEYPLANHFNQEHINYFSPISLNNLFSRHGFTKKTETTLYNQKSGEYSILSSYTFLPLDSVTATNINYYLQSEMKRNVNRKKMIDHIISLDKEVLIWGTGAYLMNLYTYTNISNLKIRYFIDNNTSKANKKLFNITIQSPSQINIKQDDLIIIVSMIYSKQIVTQIKEELHWNNEIFVIE